MSTTELDDLKSTWQQLNRNLERQQTLMLHQIRETKSLRLRSGFRPLIVGQIVQLIAGAVTAFFSAQFWVHHLGAIHLMVYGLFLQAYGIMMIIFAARDLHLIHQLDYTAPVLSLEKQVAQLRAWHLRGAVWFGVASCFVWIVLLLVIFDLLGADVWANAPAVVYWLLLSGVVSLALFGAVIFWIRQPGPNKLKQILQRSAAGYVLNRSQLILEEITRFEQEN